MTRRLVLSVTAKDCIRQTFRAGGPGGQHQNKTETGVRWVHEPSGARGEARDSRSQHDNARNAWRRMVESKQFQLWLKKQLGTDAIEEAEMSRRLSRHPIEIPESDLKWEYGEDARR